LRLADRPSSYRTLVRPSCVDFPAALIRQKLEEIGAWAVPSTATPTTVVASSSDGFDWNYAGIGAAFAAVLLLGAAGLATVRRHRHRPLAH
jgi:ABC-type uncharacterized transport system permease subunit